MPAVADLPLTILIAGLGGQGVVLAGDLLIDAALRAGFDVKKSEIHGLSRRFGSVSCQVRIGRDLHSPLRGHGGVDLLTAFEGYEALKQLPFLKSDGRALVNRMWRKPGALSPADENPPPSIDDQRLEWFDGTDVTHQAECPRSLNFYMLGVLSIQLPIAEPVWEQTLDSLRSNASSESNRQMFFAGRGAAATKARRRRRAVPR
ncbi:MAG: indolepyruvate oxidoreductase subunit beta [Planctomycetaceae bacterium]|nr:MAG: indolepyruvate oxidoreductase subunit beta [Planctomycetaceae bacterium]